MTTETKPQRISEINPATQSPKDQIACKEKLKLLGHTNPLLSFPGVVLEDSNKEEELKFPGTPGFKFDTATGEYIEIELV